jgi:hypothetical protein
MVWSEELMVHSMPAAQLLEHELDAAGAPQVERSCAEPGAPLLVRSASRPTLGLCAGGRAWSIMIAPYFSGYFYWPFAWLSPVHHDDAFALRALGMSLGAISLLLTYRVVLRLAGPGAAAVTALATAVMPCFLLVHATLMHFETLPWIWMMGALLCFLGCPGLDPGARPPAPGEPDGLPTRRLWLGGMFLGFALAANVKSIVIIAVLVALALRLGVPLGRIRRDQRARVGLAFLLPLLPMIALSFAPAPGYGDKSSGWYRTLFAHLLEPRWFLSSIRGLFLLWADLGDYLGRFIEAPPPLHVAAVGVAVAAVAFVIADTARTWIRRRGCPVTAACGLCILAYTLMVTLLYDHFPSNFTSLHTIYAAAVGVAAARTARAIEGVWGGGSWGSGPSRTAAGDPQRSPPNVTERTRASWALAPVAAIALLPFAWSDVDMIRATTDIELHTNADAERALAGYLGERAGEGAPVVTGDVMIAGVVDSLSHGAVRTLRAHDFFAKCQPQKRNPAAPACVQDRWRKLLPFAVKRSARFIAPVDWSRWGSDHISYVPALEEVAHELGYRVTLERTFPTRRGVPVLTIFRIDAPGVVHIDAPGMEP